MIRTLSLAAAVATSLALPVLAQGTPTIPEPAPGATTTAPAPAPGAAMAAPAEGSVTLTAKQAESWVGKPVYSSDGKNIGEVAAFARSTDDKVSEMHADIGGFLGIGETRVKLMPGQFALSGDRVTVDMTSEKVKDLPRVQ